MFIIYLKNVEINNLITISDYKHHNVAYSSPHPNTSSSGFDIDVALMSIAVLPAEKDIKVEVMRNNT